MSVTKQKLRCPALLQAMKRTRLNDRLQLSTWPHLLTWAFITRVGPNFLHCFGGKGLKISLSKNGNLP